MQIINVFGTKSVRDISGRMIKNEEGLSVLSRLAKNYRFLLGVVMLLFVALLNTIILPMEVVSAAEDGPPAHTKFEMGAAHNLVLKADGTVWAWGDNTYGQLGDGTTSSRRTSAKVSGLENVVAISTNSHSLAVKSDGTVWAWGDNTYGQLGDGTTTNRNLPVQVTGLTDVVSVVAGWSYSFALKTDGTVWAWGGNNFGQLGDGTTTTRTSPVKVLGLTDVTLVDNYDSSAFAIKADGTVWSWGANYYGQLGDGTKTDRSTAVQVSNLTNVVSIVVASSHSFAIKSDGTVWSWGSNYSGQLGDGTGADQYTPVQIVELTGVTTIVNSLQGINGEYSLAIKPDGTVLTWGLISIGGSGELTVAYSPVLVPELKDIRSISAGINHALAVKSDGTVWRWRYSTPVQEELPVKGVSVWGMDFSSIILGSDGMFYGAGYIYGMGWQEEIYQLPVFGEVALSAVASSPTTVDLRYGANVPVGNFIVRRGSEVLDCPQTGTNLSCQDQMVTSGTSYTYTVEAYTAPTEYDSNSYLIDSTSQTVTPSEVLTPKVAVAADQKVVAAGTTVAAKLYMEQAVDMFAEDVTITYDPTLFTFVKAEEASTGLKIYHQSETTPGTVRIVVASQGKEHGLNGTAQLLNLTLQAKEATGKGTIAVTQGLVANSNGEEIVPTLTSIEISVGQTDADVNGDGRVSLGDLAIAGHHFGMDNSNWTYPKADVDGNDDVNDFDLSSIVEAIFADAE